MTETYIVAAVRTPIGKFGGALKDISPVDLAAHVMRAAVAWANVDPKNLDQYIFGNILKHGHGQLLPRHAAIKAGIPVEVDGYAVDMLCSSGMMSTMNGALAIRAGEADLVLTGGVESMSQAGFLLTHKARWGYKLLIGAAKEHVVDALLIDGDDFAAAEFDKAGFDHFVADTGQHAAGQDQRFLGQIEHGLDGFLVTPGRWFRHTNAP